MEEGCIIDNLLKEIRSGTTLKSTRRQSSRKSVLLKREELDKLNVIVASAVSSPRAKCSKEFQFPVSDSETKTDEATTDHTSPDRVMTGDTHASDKRDEVEATSPSAGETVKSESPGLPEQSAAYQPIAMEANSDDHTHLDKETSESHVEADMKLQNETIIPSAGEPGSESPGLAQSAANQPVAMDTRPDDHTDKVASSSNEEANTRHRNEAICQPTEESVSNESPPGLQQSSTGQVETTSQDSTLVEVVPTLSKEDPQGVSDKDHQSEVVSPAEGETMSNESPGLVEQSITIETASKVMNGTGNDSRESSLSPVTVTVS